MKDNYRMAQTQFKHKHVVSRRGQRIVRVPYVFDYKTGGGGGGFSSLERKK